MSWRWAFWLSVPIGLLVLAGIVRYVPETKDERTPPGLDVLGVVLSAAGMGAIVFGLIEGQTYGRWRQGSRGPCGARRSPHSRHPIVPLRLDRCAHRRAGEFGLIFTLPLRLQNALGYSAFGTGRLIFSLAVGTFLISAMTPQLTSRLGGQADVRLGLAVEAVAVAGLALSLSADVKGWLIAAWLFAYGAGLGMATAQLTSSPTRCVHGFAQPGGTGAPGQLRRSASAARGISPVHC